MIKKALAFYHPSSQWQAFSRGLGTLCVLSALSLELAESSITGGVTFGGAAIFFLALGTMFGYTVNRAVGLTFFVLLFGLIAYLVLSYRET